MNILNSIINLLFPARCICCDDILKEESTFGLCEHCEKDAVIIPSENRCRVCSAQVISGEKLCVACKTHNRNLVRNISCSAYTGSIKEAIVNFKFNKRPENYRYFGEMILDALKEEELLEFDVLVAVPIHKNRLAERGYNQSDLLARYISDKLKITYADSELLKIKDVPPQSSIKKPSDRLKNVKGAFAVTQKSAFEGKTVLLVDDVFTTGATISEVTRILLKSGAKAVFSVTVAKAGMEKEK